MKVELFKTWFAPSEVVQVDKIRTRVGLRYREGVHIMPDNLYDVLPSGAVIIEPPGANDTIVEEFKPIRKDDLDKARDEDIAARSMEQYQKIHEEAEAKRKENRRKILEKARAAKALKKVEREATAKAEPVSAETKETI